VSGDTVLVGTDDPNGQSHFIIALSIDAMENVRKNPILGITGVAEVRHGKWHTHTIFASGCSRPLCNGLRSKSAIFVG